MERPASRLFRAATLAVYGPEHPLAFSSGGLPEDLRIIEPADIRRFHAAHYFGGNMGMIAALPKDVPLATVRTVRLVLSGQYLYSWAARTGPRNRPGDAVDYPDRPGIWEFLLGDGNRGDFGP
jgi:hypothetical protein